MNKLPQELLDLICESLPREGLKATLLVSRRLQYATERASGVFSEFIFSSLDSEEAEKFTHIYSGHRFRYLSRAEVHSHFPALQATYPEPTRRDIRKKRTLAPEAGTVQCDESLEDLDRKDRIFTEQVARAFKTIRKAEEESQHDGRIQLTVFTPTRWVHECYCDHQRHSSWRVHLLSPEQLPQLVSVRSLSICNINSFESRLAYARVDPRILVALAARCPNLEYLGSRIGADEGIVTNEECRQDFPGCNRDARHDFAKAIFTTKLPDSLRDIQLNFVNNVHDGVGEQSLQLPNLMHPATFDPFSSSLRTLSYRLRRMELRIMADETLFWPHPSDAKTSAFWPNMEYLNIMFSPSMPSGSWYFKGPLGEGGNARGYQILEEEAYPELRDDDVERRGDCDYRQLSCGFRSNEYPDSNRVITFRISPNEEMINPFLKAFAKAATNMPRLKEALLWAPLDFSPDGVTDSDDGSEYEECSEQGQRYCPRRLSSYELESIARYPEIALAWGFAYVAPRGAPFDKEEKNAVSRQLWWRVGQWRPNVEIHETIQQIGQAEHGAPLLEHWTDSYYGDGLVGRHWFSEASVFGDPDRPLLSEC